MAPQTLVIVLAVVVVVLLCAVGLLIWQRQRSEHLRGRFGPEYDRALAEEGNRREAEAELQRREERVERLHVRPLAEQERVRFATSWREVQSRFVDAPKGAVEDADVLIGRVMEARGYPVGRFEERAADVSVNHPNVVSNYRSAHALAQQSQSGRASTEDLRQAMVHYRALFSELLEEHPDTQREEVRTDVHDERTDRNRFASDRR